MKVCVYLLPAVIFLAAFAQTAAPADKFDHLYSDYDLVLKTHVAGGRVDYGGLKSDPKHLKAFLDAAAGVTEEQFRAWSEAGQLAFFINLYNAATLQLVTDHFPVKSIKEIGGFFRGPWSLKIVRLFGGTITLDNLEHDIIRKQYDEPRIHMALVCAARSCPPLRGEAYAAGRLGAQLDDQSRRFLAGPAGMAIDQKAGVVYFSSIFKWYGDDFVKKYSPGEGFPGLDATERAVARFAARYADAAQNAFLAAGGFSIRYIDYDWSLNEK